MNPTLENVPRIKAPSVREFRNRFVKHHQPVILTNLLEGQPILSLSDPAKLYKHLGEARLLAMKTTENFSKVPPQQELTLDQYKALVQKNPNYNLWCYQDMPRKMLKLLSIPAYIDVKRDSYSTAFYVSNAKPPLGLHFDVDFRQNLLTQVFGRKRYILISPKYSKRLSPYFNYSTTPLLNYSEEEKREFIKYNKGYDCITIPGETLFIPKSWWHCVEYLDFSMSLSFRFARRPVGDVLKMLPRNYMLQNIGNEIYDESRGKFIFPQHYYNLIESFYRSYPNPYERYKNFYNTLKEIYATICTRSLQGRYTIDFFDLESRRIKANRILYTPLVQPASYGRRNPDKPLSKRQLQTAQRLYCSNNGTPTGNKKAWTFMGSRKPLRKFTRLEAAQLIDLLMRG